MNMARNRWVAAACLALLWPAAEAAGQGRTAVATAGAHYGVSGLVETLAGSGWRDLWTTPVQVPVLDLDRFAGGLEPERQGGRQSYTLHFNGADGRTYIFRSVDKFLHKEALPVALRNTPVGDVVQDQIATLFPASGLAVAPLYDAMGMLFPTPTLMVMPDDPRLGEFRERFAGMLGQMEENPNEGPDETPGYAGSSRIVGTDRMLERLDETSENRLNSREYLVARLIQFMVADTDRGGDQWRFVGMPEGDVLMFRPVARDHDFAFMLPSGVMGMASRLAYPKLARFDDTYESLATLTFMTREMDRRLLNDLSRETWDSVVTAMQTQLTDDVLRAAAARLPVEWQPIASERLVAGLQGRRERLRDVADDYYRMVFREVDLHGTAEDDHAEIERLSDGSVEVRLYSGTPSIPQVASSQMAPAARPAPAVRGDVRMYFQRRFHPDETIDIRLYLHGGDDVVRVTGAAQRSIDVRVIGGAGDDVMVDSAQGGRTTFYTARGDDRVVRGRGTEIDDRDFEEWLPGRPLDMKALEPRDAEDEDEAEAEEQEEEEAEPGINEDVGERLQRPAFRDWGAKGGTGPAIDFRSRSGLLVGAGRSITRYGFRSEPYRYRLSGDVLYAVDTGGFGVELMADYRPENTNLGMSLTATGTQYESFRFFGYGNDSSGDTDPGVARVTRDQVTVRPAVYWERGLTYIGIGPIFRYGDPKYDAGSPMDVVQPLGADRFAQAGGAAELRLQRGTLTSAAPRGIAFDAGASAYPALLDVEEPFGRVQAVARTYVPLPISGPFLALRAGGQWAWGEFPVHEAAYVGGRTTLRGYTTDRFVGDAAVFGSTELHIPVTTLELLVKGELGIFGLADVGRVYLDGDSPGGWHTGYGGGIWFSTLGNTLSLSYVEGEMGRMYLRLGMPL
jgi:hypothetical protein